MWAKIESDTVTEIIPRPKAIIIGDVQYPANIFELWSASELEAIGIYPITMDKTNLKNGRYYNNTDITYTWDSDNETVTGAYGTATAQNLATLKEERKVEVNNTAGGLLDDYDWYTLRAASGGTAIPSSIATYQAAVRTKANEHEAAVKAAVDLLSIIHI